MTRLRVVGPDDEVPEPAKECVCRGERKRLLDEIFNALPAKSVREIAQQIGVDPHEVTVSLNHLRSHAAEHGWTVPHARRGNHGPDETVRFVAALVEKDGLYFDAGTQQVIRDGGRSTIKEAATKARHETAGLRAAAKHIKSPSKRRRMEDLADDFAYVARKATSLVKELGEPEAETGT